MEKFTCPRRIEDGAVEGPYTFAGKDIDTFRDDDTCSYCGSLNPDTFMRVVKAEEVVLGPTDKNYKVYVMNEKVDSHRKFYFQHLSTEQKHRFIELLNEKKIKLGYPGHFYKKPFFIK